MSERVSQQAVLERVNSRLQEKDQVLEKCQKLCRACIALGDYYLMDSSRDQLLETHVDLEKIAREQGCLADWEELETPG